MNDVKVCPLSMCGENVKVCHPNCKLLSNGECLLLKVLKKYANL